jgi:hypothetical protein
MALSLIAPFVLLASAHAASPPAPTRAISGFGGLQFLATWQSSERLLPAEWSPPDCHRERVFFASDAETRHSLGGVRLDWPGLLYRFFDDRLYAVEAEFSADNEAFSRLTTYLTERYGAPSLKRSWETAPPETYVYQAQLRSAGWYSDDGSRAIWLMSDAHRGSLTVIDNTNAQVRAKAILEPHPVDGHATAAPRSVANTR